MNGNFEHDKGSYPYSVLRQGEGAYLMHTPSLNKLSTLNLPVPVVARAALELNITYWAVPKRTMAPQLANIRDVLLRAARGAYTARDISGPAYDQVELQLAGLAD